LTTNRTVTYEHAAGTAKFGRGGGTPQDAKVNEGGEGPQIEDKILEAGDEEYKGN
jgi:hypothetical protein